MKRIYAKPDLAKAGIRLQAVTAVTSMATG